MKSPPPAVTPLKLPTDYPRPSSDPTLAQPGDLVTATAKDLNHPRLLFGDVDPGYMFFGVVVSGDKYTPKVSWNRVESALRKAKIAARLGKKKEDFKEIKWVSRALVRVLGKFDDPHMARMNNFIRASIYHEFYFDVDQGWKKHVWA